MHASSDVRESERPCTRPTLVSAWSPDGNGQRGLPVLLLLTYWKAKPPFSFHIFPIGRFQLTRTFEKTGKPARKG